MPEYRGEACGDIVMGYYKKIKDVYITKDYGMFKLLDGNRDPEKATRLKKLEKSIKEVGFLPTPVIVNERYEVIDGQARLKTAEKLEHPVYFMIVPGIGLNECVALNQASTAWTMKDYIDSYAERGNEHYVTLREYIEKYPDFALGTIEYVLSGVESSGPTIKTGKFVVRKEYKQDADRVLELMERCMSILNPRKTSRMMTALCYCFRQDDVNNEKMINAIKNRGNTIDKSYPRVIDWIGVFEDMYNYRTQAENRVYIVDRYRKKVDELNANASRKYDAKRSKKVSKA